MLSEGQVKTPPDFFFSLMPFSFVLFSVGKGHRMRNPGRK